MASSCQFKPVLQLNFRLNVANVSSKCYKSVKETDTKWVSKKGDAVHIAKLKKPVKTKTDAMLEMHETLNKFPSENCANEPTAVESCSRVTASMIMTLNKALEVEKKQWPMHCIQQAKECL